MNPGRARKKLPLWLILIIPFVVLLSGTIGITGWLSWQTENQIVRNTVGQLQQQISDRLQQQLQHYLEAPYTLTQINNSAIRLQQLDLEDPGSLTRQFWQQRQILNNARISAVYFGAATGEFTGLGFQADRTWQIGRTSAATDGKLSAYAVDDQGNATTLLNQGKAYDPRPRPWYANAVRAKQANWSQVYLDFIEPKLKVTLSQPVYDPTGQLLGVLGADYVLSHVGEFLQRQQVAQTGQIFIMERSGLLVATSTGEEVFLRDDRRQVKQRLAATNSNTPLIRSTAAYLAQRFPNLMDLNQSQQFVATIAGKDQFIQITPLRDPRGIDWLMVVVVPESDFTAQIAANRRTTIWFYGGVLGGAIGLSFLIAQTIARPIRRLGWASQAVASGASATVPAVGIRELDTLSETFNEMATQLQQSFTALAQMNQTLEQQVAQRSTALRQSEEKFSKAFRLSPHPIAINRLSDWQFIEVNQAYLWLTGYDLAEVIDRPVQDLALWVNFREAIKVGQLLRQQGSIHNFETDYRRKSGEIGTILLTAEVVELDGQPCVLSISNEITDRKRAEAAIRISETCLRKQQTALIALAKNPIFYSGDLQAALQILTETAADTLEVERVSIWFFNLNRTQLRLIDLYQLSEQQHTTGLKLNQADYPDYFQALAADEIIAVPQAQADPRTEEFLSTWLEPLGITSLLDVPIQFAGRTIGVICHEHIGAPRQWSIETQNFASYLAYTLALALESRDRQRAEAALAESERKYRALVESSQDVVWSMDTDGRYTFLNPAVRQIYGYEPEEMLGRLFTDFEPPEQQARDLTAFHNLLADESVFQYESQQIAKDGSPRWLTFNAISLRDQDGTVLGATGTANDITARKRAEQALEQAKQQAETANRAKSQFLANMSHELRTPLNAILGFSQLLTRSSLDATQQSHLQIINDSGEHLLHLINDVLDMSKIEAGRIVLNPVRFDLHHLLDRLEDLFQLKTTAKEIQLVIDRAATVPRFIVTDESKLRQVLINLLSNAIKFTQVGQVTLRLAGNPIAGSPSAYRLQVAVEDTGSGIAANELEAIFEAFVQTTTGQNDQSGTGLGLSISRKFVQLMGGELTASSTVGQGSKFEFAIPVECVDRAEPGLRSPTRSVIGLAPNQPTYRILVAEDRWESRQLLTQLLAQVGFEVRGATNGQEAVRLWHEWEPHLIWMDMRMPVMDGYEATQYIKAHLKGQATVILALTASALVEEKSVILSAGCDDFVRKPFHEAVIFEKLAEYLGVCYVYSEAAPETSQEELLTATAIAAQLAQMPSEWVSQLRQAASLADLELMTQLIQAIAQSNPPLAEALAALIDDFRYDQILNLTRSIADS
jgi:PAS domain S-box-containing protein